MTVLFDTDVLVDILLDREPFAEPAANLLAAAERGRIEGCVCAASVTDLFYLVRKVVGSATARGHIRNLLSILSVAPVHRGILDAALGSEFADFEDAVVAFTASSFGADLLVTRNVKDFKHAPLPVQTPSQLLAVLAVEDALDG